MSYNFLYYSSVRFDGVAGQIGPQFRCPVCRWEWNPNMSFKQGTKIKAIDFNRRLKFICPNDGTEINLYVAIHKDESGNEGICISRLPIDENWWVTETT